MDTVMISGLTLEMHVGLTEEERATSQRIKIDAWIEADFSEVIRTGILEDGVNYSHIRRLIREFATSAPFVLLETLGHGLAQKLLQEPNVHGAKVQIQKLDRWEDAIPGIVMERKK